MTTIDTTAKDFYTGIDNGNYDNTYVSDQYCKVVGSLEFRVGYLLGFFGSYELHEVPFQHQDEVEFWRDKCSDVL